MESSILDQNELDALLNATKSGSAQGQAMPAIADIPDAVAQFSDDMVNSLVNTLLNLTQKNVETYKEGEEVITPDKLADAMEDNSVICQTKFSIDIVADYMYSFDHKSASIIADLVLMGEGVEKEEFTDDDIDAMKETLNQTCGSSVQLITANYGKKTSCAPVTLSVITTPEQKSKAAEFFADSVYAFTYSFKINDLVNSKLVFYINKGVEEYLIKPTAPSPPPAKAKAKTAAAAPKPAVKIEAVQSGADVYRSVQKIQAEEETSEIRNVEVVKGIEVEVKIKLGETQMPLKKIIKFAPGTIIELNKDVDALLDLVVNKKTIANGVLVVVPSNNFAIRVTKILDKASRIKRLGGVDTD